MAFAGFALATALLGAIAFVTYQDYLGWRAPEYAQVFTGVTVAALVLGCLLRGAGQRWRPFGTGLVLAGVLGVATIVVLATLIGIGLRESFG